MDPRPARPLVRPPDADSFALSDPKNIFFPTSQPEPKMSVLWAKTQTGWLCGGSKSTPGKLARLLFYYNDVHAPREHAHPAGAGAVRTTIDDARRVTPLAAPGPWLVPTLTYPRGPNFVDSSDFTSRGRRTRAWRRTRRSQWRATRLGRTPRTSPRFRRRRTRSR